MSIEQEIRQAFGDKVFERPIFYNNPGGLRFELSEGGDWLDQFHVAFSKAVEICSEIFDDEILVCVRILGDERLLSVLSVIRQLKDIGLYPATAKEYWKVKNTEDPEWSTDENEHWHTIAYALPASALKKLLWCSLAVDQRIKPCAPAEFYLFNLKESVQVWPYDDRGMDVVGPNHEKLSTLYSRFSQYLLEHDLEEMNATFGNLTGQSNG